MSRSLAVESEWDYGAGVIAVGHRNATKKREQGLGYPVNTRYWNPLRIYEDLYLTEQPYGLVCGVEIDLPAND